jgi:pantothenate kinase type III
MIKGLLRRIAGELNDVPKIVATGGFAYLLLREIDLIEGADEDLTLEGLMMISIRDCDSATVSPVIS